MLGLLARCPSRWPRVPLLLVPVFRYLAGQVDRGGLKGGVLHTLFSGLPGPVVEAWAERFAARTVQRLMHAAAVTTLQSHLDAGDHVVVLSASPDLYVPRIARLLGAHAAHCTPVRWQGERLDGRLAGPNHRDSEKSRVLARLRAAHPGVGVIAYGNSDADLHHMRQCEEAVYVNAAAPRARSLAAEGIRCVDWRDRGTR